MEENLLDAPTAPEPSEAPKIERRIHVSNIVPNPYQPRESFSHSGLESLASSIKENGLWYGPIVREDPSEVNVHQLIAGERRTRAIELLFERGQHDGFMVCQVKELTDLEMAQIALSENLDREDLNAIEEGRGYANCERLGMTQAEIGKKYKKDQSTVSNRIRLLRLPESVRDAIKSGSLSTSHGVALLGLKTSELQGKWAFRVIQEEISVKALEREIREYNAEQEELAAHPTIPGTDVDPDVAPAKHDHDALVSLPPVQPRAVTEVSNEDLAFVNGEKQSTEEAEESTSDDEPLEHKSEAELDAEEDDVDVVKTEVVQTETLVPTPAASTPTPDPVPSGPMVGALIPSSEAGFLKERRIQAAVGVAHFRRLYQISEANPALSRVLAADGIGGVLDYIEDFFNAPPTA